LIASWHVNSKHQADELVATRFSKTPKKHRVGVRWAQTVLLLSKFVDSYPRIDIALIFLNVAARNLLCNHDNSNVQQLSVLSYSKVQLQPEERRVVVPLQHPSMFQLSTVK